VSAPVRRSEAIHLSHCLIGKGHPKMSWNEVVRSDMKSMGLAEDMAESRNLLRSRMKLLEPR